MIFRRKKRGIAEALQVYRARYPYYDPYEVGVYVRRVIAEEAGKKRPNDLIYMLADLNDIRRMFPFNGIVASITFVIESIVDNVIDWHIEKKNLRTAMDTLVRLYERADEEFIRRSSHMLSSDIVPGSKALVSAPGSLLEKVLFEIRAKLDGLMIPKGEPLLLGVKFAGRMHKSGIHSVYVSDSARSWAVVHSDFVLAPLYGLTTDGYIVTDAGVSPIVRLAWDEGKKVYVVGPRTSFYAVMKSEDLLAESWAVIGRNQRNGLRVRVADLLDSDEGEIYLATDREVIRVSRRFLADESKRVRKALEEMAMSVLSTYFKAEGGAG